MKLLCPAKINLRLKIEGRRTDGYHLLSMLNVLCDLHDEIEMQILDEDQVQVRCSPQDIFAEFEPKDNHIFKAAERFKQAFFIRKGVSLRLIKNIPVGAGLGGGSSDAATVLSALFEQFKSEILSSGQYSFESAVAKLKEIGLSIGSDVPFFFSQGAAYVKGIGEEVSALNFDVFKDVEFFLLLPDESISTPIVYKKLREADLPFEKDIILEKFVENFNVVSKVKAAAYSELLKIIANDLESVSKQQSSLVEEILDRFHDSGEFLVRMSGSGSALFALPLNGSKISQNQSELIANAVLDLPVKVRKSRFLLREGSLLAT